MACAAFAIMVEFSGETECSGQLVSFSLGNRRVCVREITDRWHGADHCYIKLIGDDGALYILRCDQEANRWEMTLFQTPLE